MRKIMSIALAGAVCGASLTMAGTAQAAAEQVPRCAKVRKFFSQGGQRYVRLTNLCAQRPACYTIVIPHQADVRGQLPKGLTKDVRYGTTGGPRALYVKNVAC
ncbi:MULTISPECIES: hypothetical protein [unclassified Streptomyces]|uniref:hypothetical protein n=1 Tax=unclassified Streptomyces TaxID=2593676 RepID=UPI000C27F735|nr:hypothetical protein [Streptomyces sp. CB02959]PJN41815.1 hypothetical protein CG747_03880 [Streptomyces sp. CB02959]